MAAVISSCSQEMTQSQQRVAQTAEVGDTTVAAVRGPQDAICTGSGAAVASGVDGDARKPGERAEGVNRELGELTPETSRGASLEMLVPVRKVKVPVATGRRRKRSSLESEWVPSRASSIGGAPLDAWATTTA
jgi:hypothetical protein